MRSGCCDERTGRLGQGHRRSGVSRPPLGLSPTASQPVSSGCPPRTSCKRHVDACPKLVAQACTTRLRAAEDGTPSPWALPLRGPLTTGQPLDTALWPQLPGPAPPAATRLAFGLPRSTVRYGPHRGVSRARAWSGLGKGRFDADMEADDGRRTPRLSNFWIFTERAGPKINETDVG
jgi:hypothetical protein